MPAQFVCFMYTTVLQLIPSAISSEAWKIISKAKSYRPPNKKCNLCIREKYFIICKPNMATLNNRNELVTECRHKHKYL